MHLHIDFQQPKELVFNRARLRRGFAEIGKAHVAVTRRLLRRTRRHASKPGANPAMQTGKLAHSIAYNVPRASARRPGLMVKIAPSWKGGKRKSFWGKGGTPIQGTYYPAMLYYGVRNASYRLSKQQRRNKLHHKYGGWRIEPRKNYMTEAVEKLQGWTRHKLLHDLKGSLRTERRKRNKK